MTRKTSGQKKQSSNAQTPNPESRRGWWRSPENPLRGEYWVEIFTSDHWFMRRLKWGYIILGLTVVSYVILVVIPSVLGN